MKQTVIAIQGKANQGKTETILRIYELLKGQLTSQKEITDTRLNYNHYIIGFESEGDPNTKLLERLENQKNKRCSIIICACRTGGKTANAVESLATEDCQIIWATNYRVSQSQLKLANRYNDFSAKLIVQTIDMIIGVFP